MLKLWAAGANAPSSKNKAAPGGGAPGTAPASWSLYGMMQAIEALAASNGLTSAPDVGEDVARLIDSQDNEYVLSSPKRAMELQQDLRLIADFVTIVTAAAVGGLLFAMAGQPMITGYLVAGACVGPGGMGVIKELVQVETLSQVGVVLLLFCLGLEFSMAKLRAVRGVAVGGGLLQVGMLMLMIGATSKSLGAPVAEGVFIGAFLSMSSTAVVLKLCAERDAMATVYGQITIGTLVTQDVLVGVLFALASACATGITIVLIAKLVRRVHWTVVLVYQTLGQLLLSPLAMALPTNHHFVPDFARKAARL